MENCPSRRCASGCHSTHSKVFRIVYRSGLWCSCLFSLMFQGISHFQHPSRVIKFQFSCCPTTREDFRIVKFFIKCLLSGNGEIKMDPLKGRELRFPFAKNKIRVFHRSEKYLMLIHTKKYNGACLNPNLFIWPLKLICQSKDFSRNHQLGI